MHQTFYIDADEEISSVIDRLNKSMSVDNYFVVPKRALFLQSIVNLKILKREADKMRKRVILITQDEIGASMAARSNVEVRETLDGLESNFGIEKEEIEDEEQMVKIKTKNHDNKLQDKQIRLNGVGTSEFFSSMASIQEKRSSKKSSKVHEKTKKIENSKKIHLRKENDFPKEMHASRTFGKNKLDPQKEQVLEKMFGSEHLYKMEEKKHRSSGKMKKFFVTFLALCLIVFLGSLAYLFLPSVKIQIMPNVIVKKVDLDVLASDDVKQNENNIPIHEIQEDIQISLPFDLSSETVITGQKAQGSVVIYNEYSDAPQTLMATTRLKTNDGKIFRLIKNTVVPGYSNANGQMKPGSVQADVIADEAGEDYNLDVTDFKIPGFEGGPKFEKFYAKSSGPMQGGSTNDTQPGVGVVSQSDLDVAKQKAEKAFKDKINQDIASRLAPGEIMLTQAQNISIVKSTATAKAGSKVSSFNYDITGSYQALAFSEDDVRGLIQENIKGDSQYTGMESNISKVEYGSPDTNFDENKISFKVHADLSLTPKINVDQIKKDLLGKSEEQLSDIIRKYPSIKNANIEFQPSFINHISQYPQRVDIEISSDGK